MKTDFAEGTTNKVANANGEVNDSGNGNDGSTPDNSNEESPSIAYGTMGYGRDIDTEEYGIAYCCAELK